MRFIQGLGFTELMIRLSDCFGMPSLDEELEERARTLGAALKAATSEARDNLARMEAESIVVAATLTGIPSTSSAGESKVKTWREWRSDLRLAVNAEGRKQILANARVVFPGHPAIESVALWLDSLVSNSDSRWEKGIREQLAKSESLFGSEADVTLACLNILASLLRRQGDLVAAESLYRRTLEAQERNLGADHPDSLNTLNGLGLLLHDKGDLNQAEALFRRALEFRERIGGSDHPDTLQSINNLAAVCEQKGLLAEAEALYAQAVAGAESVFLPQHPWLLHMARNLSGVRQKLGKAGG